MGVPVGKRLTKTGAILDFATRLQRDETYQTDPSFYLDALPLLPPERSPADCVKLDELGVALWNTCSKLNGSGKANQERLSRTRVFAFFLLESADDTSSSTPSGHARAIKNALKTVKECLNADLLDLAQRVLERAAGRHESLIVSPIYEDPGDHKQYAPLSLEFYSLRLALAWRQGRLDLAEHFYTKVNTIEPQSCGLATERLLDLLFEIGKQHLDQKRPEAAVKWLARAQHLLDGVDLANLNPDASDLRMVVLHTYGRALISVDQSGAGVKAYKVLDLLQRDYGGKLAVMLLCLEMNFHGPHPNAEACYTSLNAISRSAHLTESNFKMVMSYGHKLYACDRGLALKLLRDFLLQRLAAHGSDDWVERAVLTILSMSLKTTSGSSIGRPADLVVAPADVRHFLSEMHQSWGRVLDAEAAQGALVLLWKRIEIAAEDQSSVSTSEWCQTALHVMFHRAGHSNIGKIQRRLVRYRLNRSDALGAREILGQMADETQSHHLSRYLLYCTAIRLGDEGLASTALKLVESSESSSQLLYACVSETLHFGDRKKGVTLIRRLLDQRVRASIPEVNHGALLQCLVSLLKAQFEEADCNVAQLYKQISEVFEIVRNQIYNQLTSIKNDGNKEHVRIPFLVAEWHSKILYSLVVKYCKAWPRTVVLALLSHCLDINAALGVENPAWAVPDQQKLIDHQIRANWRVITMLFTRTLIYTAMARESASMLSKVTSYEEVRNDVHLHGTAGTEILSEQDGIEKDLLEKFKGHFRNQRITLNPLEFEAVLTLHSLGDTRAGEIQKLAPDEALASALESARELNAPAETFGLLADIILSAVCGGGGENDTEPLITVELGSQLLKQLIDAIRRTCFYSIVQASRWIRCLVQIVTDKEPGMKPVENKTQPIEGVVQQAIILAKNGQSKVTASAGGAVAYPADELEWLATTLFNLAVDFYLAESEETARKWAGKAVEVAEGLKDGECGTGDGGLLAGVLRGKMAELGWETPRTC